MAPGQGLGQGPASSSLFHPSHHTTGGGSDGGNSVGGGGNSGGSVVGSDGVDHSSSGTRSGNHNNNHDHQFATRASTPSRTLAGERTREPSTAGKSHSEICLMTHPLTHHSLHFEKYILQYLLLCSHLSHTSASSHVSVFYHVSALLLSITRILSYICLLLLLSYTCLLPAASTCLLSSTLLSDDWDDTYSRDTSVLHPDNPDFVEFLEAAR